MFCDNGDEAEKELAEDEDEEDDEAEDEDDEDCETPFFGFDDARGAFVVVFLLLLFSGMVLPFRFSLIFNFAP